jgi:hypothetical protein
MITRMNRLKQSLQKTNLNRISQITSHIETKRKTRYQHTFAATRFNIHSKQTFIWESSLIRIHRNNDSSTSSNRAKEKNYCERKKLIIVMFSKKSNSKTKHLFSFIIVCYYRSLDTIQFFREIRKQDRLTLRDFHHTFQDVIAARQKDLELDSDYNSLSFKLFSSVISNQFFRESILDSFSDIDLFDLEVRSSSSLKSLNRSLDKHVSLEQLVSFVNSMRIQSSRNLSSRSYERKYQNDLFIRNNAIERFFRISNMTERN